MSQKKIEELYIAVFQEAPRSVEALSASGSNRKYYRVQGAQKSVIATVGTSESENLAFIRLSRHFSEKGLNVPEVLAVSEDGMIYLQEDLGSVALFDRLSESREKRIYSPEDTDLLVKTISLLPELQFKGGEGLDFGICYPQASFDEEMIYFDLNYFKYCFLKVSGVEFDEILLQRDFETLKEDLLLADRYDTFMYRDFQARNVMIHEDIPYFIDFQGGRRGPFYYDLASFVWQAKADYPAQLTTLLVETYRKELARYVEISEEEFHRNLELFVLFRTLQVLGAYGFRGKIERKPHFLQSIPYAISNLKSMLDDEFMAAYPYLKEVLTRLVEREPAEEDPYGEIKDRVRALMDRTGKLNVYVYSFSYKKGIPEDLSGNGGGYVFDCRGVHNPGKYERYRQSTGRDADVIAFLEEDGEILDFLNHIYPLADAHVKRFVERGFTSLMFSFGCTGGQHRSVYSAEHVAAYLASKYDVNVILVHRERGIVERMAQKES